MVIPTTAENAVLAKLTYGATRSSRAELRRLGLVKWLDDQLSPTKAEDPGVLRTLGGFTALKLNPAALQKTIPYSIKPWLASDELAHIALYRQLNSKRQVYESLVEFLQDYVPVPLFHDSIRRLSYDRDAIRPNVLKTYPELLWATALHPSMLLFLSGYANTKEHPNENYGRELLELFTVTTATPYTEADVQNAARVFSGITWFENDTEIKPWVDVNKHWAGSVKVLDWTDANPGLSQNQILTTAKSLVYHLALLPETAKAFSHRMAVRFVSDNPPVRLVDAMTKTYLATKGSIPSVVKTMATHRDFAAGAGKKLKRPTEYLLSTMRALEVQLDGHVTYGDVTQGDYFTGSNLKEIYWAAMQQGHAPFNWPTPDGYPDSEAAWTTMSAQVLRWKRGTEIAGVGAAFTAADYAALFKGVKNDWSAIVDAASLLLLGRKISDPQKTRLIAAAKRSDVNFANNPFLARCKAVTILLVCTEDWNRR